MPACFRSNWGWPVAIAALSLAAAPGVAADRMVLGEYFTMLS